MSETPITFRPALAADANFVGDITETTVRAYREAVGGAFDREASRRFEPEATRIIQSEGADIGVIMVEKHDTHHQLDRLYLEPAFQRRGIGTRLLRQTKRDAALAGKPLRLRVLASNPARALYECEGFVVTETTPERFFMEWRAPAKLTTPVLETARLILRPLRMEDAPAMQARFPHWEVVCFLNGKLPWPYPLDGAEMHLRETLPKMAAGESCDWAICLREAPNDLIGRISFHPLDEGGEDRGFWLARDHWGKGIMKEAADRVTDFVFRDLRWPQMIIANAVASEASGRIKHNQGGVRVAVKMGHFVGGEMEKEYWRLDRDVWLEAHPERSKSSPRFFGERDRT